MTRMDARACRPIIPDPSRANPTHPRRPANSKTAEAPHLLAYLATVPDPRAARGRRHPLVAILALAAAAVLAGARSIAAIAEWAADTPQPVRAALGARRDAPGLFARPGRGHHPPHAGPAGRRRPGRRDRRLAGRPASGALARSSGRQRAVAVDGKTLRGARATPTAARCTCWPRWTTPPARCWPNARSTAPPRRSPRFQPLLDELDLAGVVVTADALHTHPDAAEFLVTDKQAHYLFVVKANQPTLLDRCAAPALAPRPVAGPHPRPRPRPHRAPHPQSRHRPPLRVPARRPGPPGHPQDPRPATPDRWRTVTVYAITSLPFEQARPARLADLLRGHWAIESGCTTSATSPSPRTPPRSAPAPPRTSWRACATWSSACSAGRGRSTSPPRCATTPATHADPWPPSGSASDEPDITPERRSPGRSPESRFWFS